MNRLKMAFDKHPKRIIMSAALLVFIPLIGLIIIVVNNSFAHYDSSLLRDQKIEELSFSEASLEYENSESTFRVEVTNSSNEIYNLKYIKIIFGDKDNHHDELIGYIGESLEVSETREIVAKIDKDITNSVSLEYSIVK